MIPEDLLVEILLRLPVKTLARCLCVSKHCYSIIRSRRFINLYQSRSSTRESRVMFAFRDVYTFLRWYFFSLPQAPSLVTNSTCCIDSTSFCMPVCVHGLICVEHMFRLWICNPVTGKVALLPQPGPRKQFTTWYMGYDPINYHYKVLFLSKNGLLEAYKVEVFTFGEESSWKTIEDGNIHFPETRGICIHGVLYYGAHTGNGPKIVRFDVRTEKFGKFIEFPAEACGIYGVCLGFYTLVAYQGKLALLATKTISIYDLWVLEDAEKHAWSKVSIVITREMCSYELIWPGVTGFVAGSDEFIVTARDQHHEFHLVYVDLKTQRSREVRFEGIRSSFGSSLVLAFTDYVESIVLL
ncbi:unnamed protein product [Arabidopsis halleri]